MRTHSHERSLSARPGPLRALGLLWLLLVAVALASPLRADPRAETREVLFAGTELASKAAELGSPAAIYEWVRNTHEYAAYHGSRSNAVNTYLGQRGSDVDIASVLIAMYRSQGIPTRYASGIVRIPTAALANWLGVRNEALAVAVLRDQGLQAIVYHPGDPYVELEHVWVQALLDFKRYRGAAPPTTDCIATPDTCAWIDLDPSFKQHRVNYAAIDIYDAMPFDYDRYFKAIRNDDPDYRDKNPLEIYEAQVLAYLATHHPGKTLKDIAEFGGIVPVRDGILPASLPYEVVSVGGRYDSVAEHDAAGAGKHWAKWVKLDLKFGLNINIEMGTYALADLSTKRLTLTLDLGERKRLVVRLDGVETRVPLTVGSLIVNGQEVGLGYPFSVVAAMDGAPATDVDAQDNVIAVKYNGLTVGGYYLIGTGGDTSNRSQVHRAASQLLDAARQYPVLDRGGEAVVDENGNGHIDAAERRLLDYPQALDALTGGLLYVAMSQYYTRFVQDLRRLDTLAHAISPIEGFIGVVSSTYEVEYLDETAFSVMPGGLLIDMKGIQFNGVWRTGAAEDFASRHFELIGHIGSSLEHEIWQELTGYDAVSTVRGIQMALAQDQDGDGNFDASLVTMRASDGSLASMWPALGFAAQAPSPFSLHERSLFGARPVTWSVPSGTGTPAFDTVKRDITGLAPGDRHLARLQYASDNGLDALVAGFETTANQLSALIPGERALQSYSYTYDIRNFFTDPEPASALVTLVGVDVDRAGFTASYTLVSGSTYRITVSESSLQSDGSYAIPVTYRVRYNPTGTVYTVSGGHTVTMAIAHTYSMSCNGQSYTGLPSIVYGRLEQCWHDRLASDSALATVVSYLDRNLGFDPAAWVFRADPAGLDRHDAGTLNDLRTQVHYGSGDYKYEVVLPSRLTLGDNYRFSVHLRKTVQSSDGCVVGGAFQISNEYFNAGGGYVNANQALISATALPGTSNVLPAFDNEIFNDTNLVSQVNNDTIRTPSTADPVSTVTGNMYHDETDLTIPGRGLHYAFTRSYNSGPARSGKDGPFGYGWTHSYGMSLRSNDYGDCPNCTPGTGPGKRPENGNGITGSISYVDERGGEHTYLRNESSGTIAPPPGEFERLDLDTPTAGEQTLTFRNGTRYVFAGTGLASVPGRTARLARIEDAYGNRLDLGYDAGGRLVRVRDNLGVAGRTGLSIVYSGTSTHIARIEDWTGRAWQYGYDSAGNLISVTDPLGHTRDYGYDAAVHLLQAVVLPEDRGGARARTEFAYYRNRKAFNYRNALGQTETLDYDLYRQRTRVTDPRGFVREHYYDPDHGALVKMIEPDGAVLSFANNADGLRWRKTDGLGYATAYSYRQDRTVGPVGSDTFGLVTREIDALSQPADLDYGLYDQPTRTVDRLGNPSERIYYEATDAASGAVRGKLKEVRATVGERTGVLLQSWQYVAAPANPAFGQPSRRIEYIDPDDPSRRRITEYAYAANGIDVASETLRGGSSGGSVLRTFTYDTLGRVTSETVTRRTSVTDPTPLALTTHYEYDALGRRIRTTDPRGDIAETRYDANGQVSEQRVRYLQPDGSYATRIVARHRYDAADRLIETLDVLGHATRLEYDASGNVAAVTDANGHTSRYEYDAMGRRTAVVDANGYRTETEYDLAGRPVAVRDANGNVTRHEYDPLGRLTRTRNAEGRGLELAYDANGNLTHSTDANATADPDYPRNTQGASLFKEYDELGRVVREVDAQGGATAYAYDLLGNMRSITDAEGQTTRFVYDELGRPVETLDPVRETPDRTDRVLLYDETGNPLLSEDRSGRQTRNTYDVLGRLVRAEYLQDGTSDHYTYDAFGDLTQVANDAVTYSYTYTARHELATKIDSRLGKTLAWTYDPVGKLATKTDYQGDVTHYQHDGADRLIAEQNSAFVQVTYHYDPAGRLLDRILSSGARTSYTYDRDNRLTTLRNLSADGTAVSDLAYTRDEMGNILSIADSVSGRVLHYGYDALYRLTAVNSSDDREDRVYTYDRVGNRLSETANGVVYRYCYDPADCDAGPVGNRLYGVRIGGPNGPWHARFAYDDSGRVLEKRDRADGLLYGIRYNGKGQAAEIATAAGAERLAYDPAGYRIAKADRLYHLEGEHLEAVYGTAGNLRANYLRGAVIDEIVNGYVFNSTKQGDWRNYTFHHDHLNSVTALTSADGSIKHTCAYDPFGALAQAQCGDAGNDLLFTGRELDRHTGLYYYRARYFDYSIGRFLSEDPLAFASAPNFYAYVGNNPINAIDPEGLETVLILKTQPNPARDPADPWAQAAKYAADQAKSQYSGQFEHLDVVTVDVQSVAQVDRALSSYSDIVDIRMIGHANENLIAVGSASGPGTNISASPGVNNVDPNSLNWSNLTKDAVINIWGCHAGNGNNSIGQQISNASGAQVNAPDAYINFSNKGEPFIRWFRFGSWNSFSPDSTAKPRASPSPSTGVNAPSSQLWNTGAAGGFVLYPNKYNSASLRAVYTK